MKKIFGFLSGWAERLVARKWDVAIAGILAACLLIALSTGSGRRVFFDYREGDVAPFDIRVPHNIEIIDREATAEKVQRTRAEVLPVFTRDPGMAAAAQRGLKEYFNSAMRISDSEGLSEAQKADGLTLLNTNIPPRVSVLLLSFRDLRAVADACVKAAGKVYEKGYINPYPFFGSTGSIEFQVYSAATRKFETVAPEDLFDIRTIDLEALSREALPSADARTCGYMASILRGFLKPDIAYDVEMTARRVDQRLKGLKPVMMILRKGQIIVPQGTEITADTIALFQEISLKIRHGWQLNLGGIALFYALIAGFLFWGIRVFEPTLTARRKYFYIFLILTVVWFAIVLGLSRFEAATLEELPRLLVLPVIVPAIVLPVFFGVPFSVFCLICFMLVSGLLFQSDVMDHVFVFMFGIAALVFKDYFRRRDRFLLGGLWVLLSSLAIVSVMGLIHYYDFSQFSRAWAVTFVNSAISVLAAMGLISFFEIVFNIAIDQRLLELCNLNKPIFKRMLLEAPGTYHHSVLVANLAEAAALEIAANSLLVKAASYYHDIGKLSHPEFFTENANFDVRIERESQSIKPSLYVTIVKQHLKESVEMGRKLRLPSEVLDLVSQHHGKGLIKYFYFQALNQGGDSSLSKEDFVYPSENPKSREAVILLLADSVEAASRSVEQPNYQRIQGLVEDVVNSKFSEGILNESEITLGEIQKIGEAFIRILMGFFHSRIKYPGDSDIKSAEQTTRDRPSAGDRSSAGGRSSAGSRASNAEKPPGPESSGEKDSGNGKPSP